MVDDRTVGLLQVKHEQPDRCNREEAEFCEEVAQTLGLAVADRRAQAALREQVKELTCLYGIAQVAEEPALALGQVLQRIVELLPPAWQYPENAAARIIVDHRDRNGAGSAQWTAFAGFAQAVDWAHAAIPGWPRLPHPDAAPMRCDG
jgi:hypothetical protein